MSTIKIRLNRQEKEVFNEYAKMCGLSLSALFKQTLEEKIEDLNDMKKIREYEKDIKYGNSETYTHNEVKKTLGL